MIWPNTPPLRLLIPGNFGHKCTYSQLFAKRSQLASNPQRSHYELNLNISLLSKSSTYQLQLHLHLTSFFNNNYEIHNYICPHSATPERYAFFRLDTISIRYEGFFLDTIRYRYNISASKKTFFLRNFRQIFRIFGEFLEFSALLLLLLRTLVHGFSEFSGNFLNFRRIFSEKRQKNHWF